MFLTIVCRKVILQTTFLPYFINTFASAMIRKILSCRIYKYALFFYSILFISSCRQEDKKPDVSTIPVNLSVKRFEQDLFNSNPANMKESLANLESKYGNFFNLFAYQVTSLGHPDTAVMIERLTGFVTDTNFRTIYNDCQQQFADFSKYTNELTESFRYYKYYLPKKTIPEIVTLISSFSYPVISDSTSLGISLDMYLGSNYKYYNTLEPPLPNYLRNRMRPEYLVSDAMKGWLMSDYDSDEPGAKMLDRMISQGRILYMLNKILPDVDDTLKTGYSKKQLNWCYANEKQIWSFFVDNKLLFTTEPNLLNKYVNEGPTTNGFPKDAPGNIGQFLGWQIVKSYMKNNPLVSPAELMEKKDLQAIFNTSKYKPAK